MTTPDKDIMVQGVLLAAGASRRLGQPKQLVRYHGKPLIIHAIDEIKKSKLNDIKVVLGCMADIIEPLIPSDVRIVYNKQWQQGMGTSISVSVKQVDEGIGGILIALVDQYRMSSELLDTMIDAFRNAPNKLIVSRYGNDVCGSPAIFPRRLFNELKTLAGDRGAGKMIRNILSHHPDQVVVIPFQDGHLDVDKPEDLEKLQQ